MLIHEDLASWRRWQRRRQGVARQLRASFGRSQPGLSCFHFGAGPVRCVFALDSDAASHVEAILAPMRVCLSRGWAALLVTSIPRGRVEVAAGNVGLGGEPRQDVEPILDAAVRAGAVVVSAGSHLPAGSKVGRAAATLRLPHVVVQHGLITPFSPPICPNETLLAWTDADADFYLGQRDPGMVVGSQLLWRAAQGRPTGDLEVVGGGVTFLGQLHGAELRRSLTRKSVESLLRSGEVRYRPHPGERDRLSRAQHARWEARGVQLLPPGPLSSVPGPVLAHFSTGLLEAAALGIPSYAFCVEPPRWLEELWDRYEMSRWGDSIPTAVTVPEREPSEAIADFIEGLSA